MYNVKWEEKLDLFSCNLPEYCFMHLTNKLKNLMQNEIAAKF
jgi:hypothetical protein